MVEPKSVEQNLEYIRMNSQQIAESLKELAKQLKFINWNLGKQVNFNLGNQDTVKQIIDDELAEQENNE